MRNALVMEAERSGYGIDQIADRAITIGELKKILDEFNDDDLFVLSHDNGYTYGSVDKWEWKEYNEDEDGEWEQF